MFQRNLLLSSSRYKSEGGGLYQTLETIYQTTRPKVPEDRSLGA
jgi:hypothetical protein